MTRVGQALRNAANYLSKLTVWLFSARPLVAIVAAIAVVVLASILATSCHERQIRFSGMVLQLVGVGLVAVGLRDTRKAFEDQPTIWGWVTLFLSRRPSWRPTNQVIQAEGISASVSFGSARIRQSPALDSSIEQRLTMLERQYSALFDEVGILAGKLQTKLDEVEGTLSVERNERRQADLQAREQLRKAVAEGIPLASVGVIAFLVGITTGTASPEIASLFGWGACQ
ncbi:hypothetical protein [Bradyrhizobium sp. CCBAU 11361]|uniref:hypothetical protein n=1 Tax=Bradyrhizobium sp. CCBAU 11361 TaxID=1630812 RepID=UPI00230451B6|nr:hypothetical protein [Bradyrhizobium sp. CCBAU 11361]